MELIVINMYDRTSIGLNTKGADRMGDGYLEFFNCVIKYTSESVSWIKLFSFLSSTLLNAYEIS